MNENINIGWKKRSCAQCGEKTNMREQEEKRRREERWAGDKGSIYRGRGPGMTICTVRAVVLADTPSYDNIPWCVLRMVASLSRLFALFLPISRQRGLGHATCQTARKKLLPHLASRHIFQQNQLKELYQVETLRSESYIRHLSARFCTRIACLVGTLVCMSTTGK